MDLRRHITIAALSAALVAPGAEAALVCQKPNGTLALRDACKRRETPVAPATLGFRDVFGDGSAGARFVGTDEVLGDPNLSFTDFAVAPGVTLTVPSGTVIRCTGSFTNDGTIVVEPAAAGGRRTVITGGVTTAGTEIPAHPGLAAAAAQAGDIGDPTIALFGGAGAPGIGLVAARQLVQPALVAGGGGGASGLDLVDGVTDDRGSDGGGAFFVYAAGSLVNRGAIVADGAGDAGGGGAGGLVVLASRTRIEQASGALLRAAGGVGEGGDSNEAPSGGGGGGIAHLLAPAIDDAGAIDVSGGPAGALSQFAVSAVQRAGGGGGGAFGGAGGRGGSLGSGVPPAVTGAEPGAAGVVLRTLADPASLL